MSRIVLELDDDELRTGYVTVTKVDEKGKRKGKMPLQDTADLLRQLLDWEAGGRKVRMISRFEDSPFLAFGQNGAQWQAVKTIPPAEYFLISATEKVYKVRLPRLVVYVGNFVNWPRIFWTPAEHLTSGTTIYPLIIGNTYTNGRVCTGTTGLQCKSPDDIDTYIRRLIETPATHTVTGGTDQLYRVLEQRGWAPGIGRKHGIQLQRLLTDQK